MSETNFAGLEGVRTRTIGTPRLQTAYLESGPRDGVPVVFVHGNVSSSGFFAGTLAALPDGYRGVAPDLRGFGGSETRPLDATRGVRDFSEDVRSFVEELGIGGKVHLVGWSAGGSVAMRYAMDYPNAVGGITLVNPMSPYGFGGTKDAVGTPCHPDFAGSGGGTANPEFVRRLAEGDRSDEDPNSPRNVMNTFYFKPPFRAEPDMEEEFVTSMLLTKTDEGNYPGDMTTSENWPGVAPGTVGMNNAISPKYCDLTAFVTAFVREREKPEVLWIRGAEDQVVSDTSSLDFGYLGQLGLIPGWPGDEAYPPQPMVSQMRMLLDAYTENGGRYREEVIQDCGHSPHIEKPEEFQRLLFAALAGSGE